VYVGGSIKKLFELREKAFQPGERNSDVHEGTLALGGAGVKEGLEIDRSYVPRTGKSLFRFPIYGTQHFGLRSGDGSERGMDLDGGTG
jgi:hypothetical protein